MMRDEGEVMAREQWLKPWLLKLEETPENGRSVNEHLKG